MKIGPTPLSHNLLSWDISPLVQHLHEPDILFVPHDLWDQSLAHCPESLRDSLAASGKVLIVEKRQKSPTKLNFRMRIQAKSAAIMQPLQLPFLEVLVREKLLKKSEADKFQVAFDEGLTNAVDHGCLELDSKLRTIVLPDGRSEYDRLRETRLTDPLYSQRLVWLSFSLRNENLVCRIKDSGPGFDSNLHTTNIMEIEKPSGRGLMLMQRFADSIKYNKRNNQVTLIKQFDPN